MTEPAPRVGIFGHRGFLSRALASWIMPAIMIIAYAFMAVTAETDSTVSRMTRIAWMSIGLAFVLVVWWLFKLLVERGAMDRAVLVGDADRIRELADAQLARRRGAARLPIHVYRALALALGGDHAAALGELDRVDATRLPARLRALAGTTRVGALAELGRVAEARTVFDRELAPRLPELRAARAYDAELELQLAEARLRFAEHDLAGARALLAKIGDDVRAGAATRAAARATLARIAAADQNRPLAASPT